MKILSLVKKSSSHLLIIMLIINTSVAQIKPADNYPPVTIAGSQFITFNSAVSHHDYTVSISLPGTYNDSVNKKYPVLYVLDGQWSFTQELGLLGGLNYDNLVPEVITVAIGWPDKFDENRARDMTPTKTQNQFVTGDGKLFLNVIKNEIKPFIDARYRGDKTKNILSGGSYGGLFALYTLFQEPDMFTDFIIGSPSVDYDDNLMFKMEEAFSKTHKELNKKIFFHWGRYETDFDAQHYFERFYAQMKLRKYHALEMDSVGVPQMAHASNGPYGEAMGLQFVLQRPDLELAAGLLDEYAGKYEQNVTLTHEGKWLYLSLPTIKARMRAATDNLFYIPGLPGTGEFVRNENGKVISYMVRMYGQTMSAKKLSK